jgi:hypothetical protein
MFIVPMQKTIAALAKIGKKVRLSFNYGFDAAWQDAVAVQVPVDTWPLSTKDSNSLSIQGLSCDSSGITRRR